MASIALEDFARSSGVRGFVLEGLSGVILRACSDDWLIIGIIGVKKVLPGVYIVSSIG